MPVASRGRVRSCATSLVAAVLCLLAPRLATAQTPGDNVNMVSGTQWPFGDPFLQRQNEPSLAVSSRSSLRLLAGANDYRTVDLPAADTVPGQLVGDAWLGLFESTDGGQSWQSTLLPGYPQDTSPEGLASPLKTYRTAADPTVRAATHGLFYYSGIAYDRVTNQGGVFVATLVDTNLKENGTLAAGSNPIRYVRTTMVDTGTTGQFLDKTWLAVDIPRAGAGQCTISLPGSGSFPPFQQSMPAGTAYIVWSRFTGATSTKIMLARSQDCGQTWSHPIKLSESNAINQGTVVAVEPLSGAVYVAWRRFASSSESDAILFAKSTDFGKTFGKALEVASFIPFDQTTTTGSFRTNALPTLAVSVDAANVSRVHLAWSGRQAPGGDARVLLATSTDGGDTWSAPVAVDAPPVTDDSGQAFARGHRFMPQLTFAAGKLMLLYYDQRLDHTVGRFTPHDPFSAVTDGKFYQETREPRGELVDPGGAGGEDQVFTPLLTDAGLSSWRHTLDLRVAQATPGANPAFHSVALSRFPFGTRGDEMEDPAVLRQLQVNPPNLPLFQLGTVPFIGDYIDIAGEIFTPPPAGQPNAGWQFNLAPAGAPAFYATWTSNQDVRPPADGDWANYTPPGLGGPSVFDPTQTSPPCATGQEGMRNQNIYMSRISQGLLVTSPQNAKPLSATLERAFAVVVQNETSVAKSFRLAVSSQPAGGYASFLPSGSSATCPAPPSQAAPPGKPWLCTGLDVDIPAHSSIARSVFARSTSASAPIPVQVHEIAAAGAPGVLAGGLDGFVTLNAEVLTTLAQPDGTGDPISSVEVYSPSISSANVSNANVSNANVSNANVSNANVSNANVSNANVSNAHVANPELANISNANVSNANVSNANVSNANISNANVSNANVSNAPLADATFTVTNDGNTTHTYHVTLVGNAPAAGVNLQLILNKLNATPTSGAYGGGSCVLEQEAHNILVANVIAPAVSAPDKLFDPNIPDSSSSNATLALAPGESAAITLRGTVTATAMTQIANQVWPRIIAHAGNGTAQEPFADPLIVSSNSGSLGPAAFGVPYSATLQASGGKPGYTWSLVAGALPGGLQLAANGVVSGTPSAVGTFVATVQVEDSKGQTATQVLQLAVSKASVTVGVASSPNPSVAGQSVTVQVVVTPAGTGTPTGSVSVSDGAGASCTIAALSAGSGSCALALVGTGTHVITATYSGDGNFLPGTGSSSQTVQKAGSTTTILTDLPDPSTVGQAVVVTFAVAPIAPASGTPGGTVTVSAGAASCTAPVATGTCTLSLPVAGSIVLTATYSGDGTFGPSSDTEPHTVLGAGGGAQYTFTGFLSPLSTAGTYPNPSASGSWTFGRALPIKWQLKDKNGVAVTKLGSATALRAIPSGGTCPGPTPPPTGGILLYSPATGTTGGSTFKFETNSNQFVFNWDTSTATTKGTCYWIVLQLDDGSTPRATTIRLK